jgi:hypothetical protein
MMMMMIKMIFGASGGMNFAGETEVLGGTAPAPLCPPQNPT